MRSTELTLPELALVAATRGTLGAGVGLLVADKLTPETRRAVGRSLFLIGLVSSLPLAMLVFGRRP
jgi:sorbitol-specific phosphotransferase system component IIBC